jgi:putative sigma-54 modulation protein
MEIIISGRHLVVTDSLRAYAEEKLQKIAAHVPKLTSARIVLDQEKAWQLVEITLHGKHLNLVATARTEEMYASIDEAIAKLDKQLHKFVEKIHDHRPHNGKEEPSAEPKAES